MYLCCGDALFDLFETGTGKTTAVQLSGNVGGSPLNVAVGLARLGHKSRFFTKLSADLFGQRMRRYLDQNGVDYRLSIDTTLNTTLAIVETADDGAASYVFYTDNTADVSIAADEIPGSLTNELTGDVADELRVLHFASYSTVVEPTAGSLAAFAAAQTSQRIISYDPNLRPTIEPDIDKWRATFEAFAPTANLIKASDEDIESLMGKNSEERFVADSFAHGAELVFITRGPNGASGFTADGRVAHCPGMSVDVVDTVGAGDTFHAAILHWLAVQNHLAGKSQLVGAVDLESSMNFAIRAAAVTCTRSGADLPVLADLD